MSRSREEKLEQLRHCALILFDGSLHQYASTRISDEAIEGMLAVMHPEVLRIAKVLEEVKETNV